MLSAIILCRQNSRRLPKKHFLKIGEYSIIESLLNIIKINKNINEIYLATGPFKKNFIFQKIKKKFPTLKFYYHKNDNDVTGRINSVSKKIKNNYFVLISGDCPLIDNNFINKSYKFFKKNEKYDAIKFKNTYIEGVDIYKKKIWPKINFLSKTVSFKEHPGYVLNYSKNLFDIKHIDVKKNSAFDEFKTSNKIRMSVDTQSDLDFFRIAYLSLKKRKKKFTYENVHKLKKIYQSINSHVFQQKPFLKKKYVYIITSKSNQIGLGHFKRCQTIKREIDESTEFNTKLIILKNENKILKLKKLKKDVVLLDVPGLMAKKILKIVKFKKVISIDNIINYKNAINIIPGLINKIKGTFSGKKYLIINRKINYLNYKNDKIQNFNIIVPGGVSRVPKQIIDFCVKSTNENFLFIINKKNNLKNIKILRKNNIPYLENPKNFLELLKLSKKQIIRHGVLTYEILAMSKKPMIWTFKENSKRMIAIKYLKNKRLINEFNEKIFYSKDHNLINKLAFDTGCQSVIHQIKRII